MVVGTKFRVFDVGVDGFVNQRSRGVQRAAGVHQHQRGRHGLGQRSHRSRTHGAPGLDQRRGGIQLPRDLTGQLCRRHQPTGLGTHLRRQFGGVCHQSDRAGDVGALDRCARSAFQSRRGVLVGAESGMEQMPGAAHHVGARGGEIAVRVPALLGGGQLDDGQAHQGMGEADPPSAAVDDGDARLLGGVEGREPVTTSIERRRSARPVERDEQQDAHGFGRQSGDPGGERLGQPPAQRQFGPLPGDCTATGHDVRKHQQCQRIALGLRQRLRESLIGDVGKPLREKGFTGVAVEGPESQFRQTRRGEVTGLSYALGRDDGDRGSVESSGEQTQHRRGEAVHPLHVVDDDGQRALSDQGVEQQPQRADHGQFTGGRTGCDTHRHAQRVTVRRGQALHVGRHRQQELVERRVADVTFELRTGAAQHPLTHGEDPLLDRRQQGGLPDPGLTGHDEHVARGAVVISHRAQSGPFGFTADEIVCRRCSVTGPTVRPGQLHHHDPFLDEIC
ncbi:Uncharacterised protein [Mycobacteroides abscessus subsp. abscessus]|nr:Uncharacterised protein [Mycobacteroides abscessus subsp. abscessus]